MNIHRSIESIRRALAKTQRIAFAPTMGNLHEGHLSLMCSAREHGEVVVSSIFVNRLQFGPNEDFDRYPRTFDDDCTHLEAAGVDHLFAPDERELYPSRQRYQVIPASEHETILEGACRPGHFRGVATVVAKLFNIIQPTTALLGKKDYQQLMIIRNMVRELNMPIDIIGCPTVRSKDGLALSSRNAYLSLAERQEAPRLYRVLSEIVDKLREGGSSAADLEGSGMRTLEANGWAPDYVAIRRQEDLSEAKPGDRLVVLAAARLGQTRLIDNIEVG